MLNMLSTYKLFVIPMAVIFSSQLLKLIIEAANGNFSWRNFDKYGGMPSSHTAFVTSLVTIMGATQGINSSVFAISFILAVLTIRDAMGLRKYLGNNSKVINLLIKKLPDKDEIEFPHIEERLGHTPIQVFGGMILGFAVSMILLRFL
ncbi:MAG: divergent PAP2 family protein [bacterium]